jgi:hypothetical protein
MSAVDPYLIRSTGSAGEPLVRLGVPVLDRQPRRASPRAPWQDSEAIARGR